MKLRMIALIAVVLTVYGCSKDCPVCPTDKPTSVYKGWLYYAAVGNPEYGLFRIDMETDSLVDSLPLPVGGEALTTSVSSDGQFVAVSYGFFDYTTDFTRIYNAQTLARVTDIADIGPIAFSADGTQLFGGRGGVFRSWDAPTFSLNFRDTALAFGYKVLDSKRDCAYGYGMMNLREEYHIFRYDYVNKVLTRVPIVNYSGDTAKVYAFCLNSRGDRLYLKFIDGLIEPAGESYVAAYDLKSQQLIWQFRTLSPIGGVAVSPDDREVYMGDPGVPGYIPNTGTLFILDAVSGSYLAGISLYGYLPYPYPTAAEEIVFSPKGERAYISPGSLVDRPQGSVMVVDTKKREIIKIVSPDMQRSPHGMSIGPKL